MQRISTLPGIAEVLTISGAKAPADAVPTLLLDVPHGATRTADFDALVGQLVDTYDPGLIDFFHVNTDAGAPEVAVAAAELWVAAFPGESARVLRSLLPRTFVDCNRIVEGTPEPGMTPGVPPWVRDEGDLRLLLARHHEWRTLAEAEWARTCGAGGYGIAVHTYAPRSVDVQVDERIVENLRAAWAPGTEDRWPLRPEVDLITRTLDGKRFTPDAFVDAVIAAFVAQGFTPKESETYPLHPSTLGFKLASPWPSQSLALEIRRDLLAAPWLPFVEKSIDPAAAERAAKGIVDGVRAWRTARA